MEARRRIEQTLAEALGEACPDAPPRLQSALQHAVFPGGARLRPRLTLAVFSACASGDSPKLADGAGCAIELLHCASLVHDDLPCFDDADTRRGRASVHRAFGEPLAVLAGDALIVLAFQTLARSAARSPQRLAKLVEIVARAVGAPHGIVAGQAWECEPFVDLAQYHRAKTGVLFAAATAAGAAAAGRPAEPWFTLGDRLGEAYQVADDLRDVGGHPAELGKPIGRDAALGRRSAVADLGVGGAIERLERLVGEAVASIPDCPGAADLQGLILAESRRFVPEGMARLAA